MDRNEYGRLLQQHASFPHVVSHLVEVVDDELLRAREAERRWSPLEILAHLRDEEVEDFRPRAHAAAAGEPIPWAIAPEVWVIERRYNEMDPASVLAEFTTEREKSCAWLRELDLARLESALEHPGLGKLRCGDFVAAWRMHDLLHLRQLSTAIAVLTSRTLAGWRIDYAGKVPQG
ncbi:MAG: DinB family protein [Candidatus Latescibacterota bacterium]|nr:MAG: DinB family protein [Candidatus Latescibacterota bacterium]